MKKHLIVASHPDDEVLGAGAYIHAAVQKGDKVFVCMMSHLCPTRDDDLLEGMKKSHEILGVAKSYVADFGCMRFKDADHHQVVRFIEEAIKDCEPDIVITHHLSDLHIDHKTVNECCLEAVKIPMRQIAEVGLIKKVLCMEVPSSTDWSIEPTGRFIPNYYYAVNDEDIYKKIEATAVYDNVLRKSPHPRSKENIIALSQIRGSQCGSPTGKAEAFQVMFDFEV